jgi:hypothetical protein
VPVTARLSQKFYEKLGEDVTNELVNWFNSVDATYRTDLREMNEANFARFDAKLEQRLAQVKGELVGEIARAQSATVKWMFAFWVPTAAGIVATAGGVVALLIRH